MWVVESNIRQIPYGATDDELMPLLLQDIHRSRYRTAHGDLDFGGQEHLLTMLESQDLEAYGHTPHADLIGRQEDILNLEFKILLPPYSNVIIITGVAGCNKSALCMFLCWWWMVTGFVEFSFYLNADPGFSGNLREEMTPKDHIPIRDCSIKKRVTIEDLQDKRNLIIIDNLDHAVHLLSHRRNTYSMEEREWVEHFAKEMTGGKSNSLLRFEARKAFVFRRRLTSADTICTTYSPYTPQSLHPKCSNG